MLGRVLLLEKFQISSLSQFLLQPSDGPAFSHLLLRHKPALG